jgi:GNAT superfamily N-acetyltransferase
VSENFTFSELTRSDINEFTPEDLGQLLPQLSPSAKPPTEEQLHQMLMAGTRSFVAKMNTRIIGVVLLCPMVGLVGRKDWIEDVVVDSKYRGHGIARRLMTMAEAASLAGPAKSLNLTSNPTRLDARRLYESLGYELRDTGVFRKTRPSLDTIPAIGE